MATTDRALVVCDAGPLIHLDELDCLDLLENFGKLLIPKTVWREAIAHRPQLLLQNIPAANIVEDAAESSPQLLSLGDSLELDTGEKAAIALLENGAAKLFFCDDAAARLAAESLGFTVHGTIGILVRSIRRATRTRQQILEILQDIPRRSSLHISRRLLETVIVEVGKHAADL